MIYLTFVPPMWVSDIVVDRRDRSLDELARKLPEEGRSNLLTDESGNVMNLYDRIAAVSTETQEARVIARRVIAVVAVLLPQLLAVGLKLLHL